MAEILTLRNEHHDSVKLITGTYDSINIRDCSGIIFEVDVGHKRTSDEYEWSKIININNCNDITFQNSNISSDDDRDNSNDIYGLWCHSSSNIKFLNNNLHDLIKGAVFTNVTNLEVTGNNLYNIRSDGFDFVGIKQAKINNNTFKDFAPSSTDHPDAIQFWGNDRYLLSEDFEILGNTFLLGNGKPYQQIFLGGPGQGYKNFRIAENVMYVGQWHGISVYQGQDGTIEYNTVLTPLGTKTSDGKDMYARITNNNPKGLVTIEKNIAAQVNIQGDNTILSAEKQAIIWPVINSREDFHQYKGYGANIFVEPEPTPELEPESVGHTFTFPVEIDGQSWLVSGTLSPLK